MSEETDDDASEATTTTFPRTRYPTVLGGYQAP
jgi:hypothetical protein